MRRKKPNFKEMQARAAERRAEVAKLARDGLSQIQIARKIGKDTGTVCRDMQVIRLQNETAGRNRMQELVADELGKLDKLEATIWDALKRATGSDQAGAQFAETLVKLIQTRAQLLGLSPPVRIQIRGRFGFTQLEIDEVLDDSDDAEQFFHGRVPAALGRYAS